MEMMELENVYSYNSAPCIESGSPLLILDNYRRLQNSWRKSRPQFRTSIFTILASPAHDNTLPYLHSLPTVFPSEASIFTFSTVSSFSLCICTLTLSSGCGNRALQTKCVLYIRHNRRSRDVILWFRSKDPKGKRTSRQSPRLWGRS